jgi:hypothetical protein
MPPICLRMPPISVMIGAMRVFVCPRLGIPLVQFVSWYPFWYPFAVRVLVSLMSWLLCAIRVLALVSLALVSS